MRVEVAKYRSSRGRVVRTGEFKPPPDAHSELQNQLAVALPVISSVFVPRIRISGQKRPSSVRELAGHEVSVGKLFSNCHAAFRGPWFSEVLGWG